jgi:hypothetical protein
MIEIERLEFIEEKMGVKLESLFACEDGSGWSSGIGTSKRFVINGELHTIDGSQLSQNVRLVISAHDSSSRVLGSGSIEIKAKDFFGFDTFSDGMHVYACEDLVTKVRIYPTPSKYR